MSKREWTAQQKEALEYNGTLTVLSAAAGSGKTTVLVEKALRILLDEENKTPADRLLIVTFSNASAKEFKNRIEKGINLAIKENPENSYIKSQKVALQKADISTIHSFCIKLAKENFEALDIAPDFTICDDAQSMLIHEKAIDMAMEYGYKNEDFQSFVTLFGKSSQDTQVREFLKYMYYYFSALPFPKQKAIELAEKAGNEEFEESEVYKYLWNDIGQQIDYAVYLINRVKQLIEYGEIDEYREGTLINEKSILLMKECYEKHDIFGIKSIANEGLVTIGRLKKGTKSEFSEAAKTANDALKSLLKDIASDIKYLDSDVFSYQIVQTKKYIKAITDVFVFYSEKLMEIKKQQKSFEFSDFEHFAVQLLIDESGNRTTLANALQEKYVKIMEDEFQDTSFVQDMIFKTIAREKEENLFVVGDVKQSIYGFRKASPQILLEKRAREKVDNTLGKTIVLTNNFRSEVNVIKGVNFLFEKIMTKEVGGVDYSDGEQLLPSPKKTDSKVPGTSIMIANDKENEAVMVAEKIQSLVENKFTIIENGEERVVNYGDFCILLRNKKNFDKFENALKERGIKTFVKDDKPLLEKPEVQSIISLLKVINNPLQEVYLTAGMFGDIFTFTLDEILEICIKDKKENLYKLLSLSDNPKAVEFLNQLKDFSFVAKIYSPDKLIDYIINKTGYYTNLAFAEDGNIKRENVRRFIAMAKKYAQSYQNYLGDFLRYLDLCIETGKGSDENMQRPANTVAIMTMHTSKGLEFPICFVSGLGTAFNKQDRSKRLMIDPVLGMATYANESFGYNKSTAGIQAIKKKILAENANDEMRLLYVALTRAKNYMFLTAQYTNLFTNNSILKIAEKTSEKVHYYAVRKANTPMEWIIMGYLQHKILSEYMLIKENIETDEFVSFEIKDVLDTETEQTEEELQAEQSIDFDKEKAKDNFTYIYHDIEKTTLPIKVSVGEIAKSAPKVTLKKPDFVKKEGATATEKGTQMHLFAQHSDILLARTNLDNEIEKLSQKNIIDKKLINKKQIETFINSDLATLILNGEKVYNEKDFLVPYNAALALNDDTYKDETIMLQGVIDCIVLTKDKAYVIDYKTDRVDDMNTLYERYHKQLELYRIATGYLYQIDDIECIIYSFYLGKDIRF